MSNLDLLLAIITEGTSHTVLPDIPFFTKYYHYMSDAACKLPEYQSYMPVVVHTIDGVYDATNPYGYCEVLDSRGRPKEVFKELHQAFSASNGSQHVSSESHVRRPRIGKVPGFADSMTLWSVSRRTTGALPDVIARWIAVWPRAFRSSG